MRLRFGGVHQDVGVNTPKGVYKITGSRAFSIAGPRAWNQLPIPLNQMDCQGIQVPYKN